MYMACFLHRQAHAQLYSVSHAKHYFLCASQVLESEKQHAVSAAEAARATLEARLKAAVAEAAEAAGGRKAF